VTQQDPHASRWPRFSEVVAAAGLPGVVDGGEEGEQMRRVDRAERVDMGELGEGGWDRG
jgi:hypothetical protein